MLTPWQVEELIKLVGLMDRQTLIGKYHDCRSSFPVDFTDDYLRQIPLERLRHIFVALCLQNSHLPTEQASAV